MYLRPHHISQVSSFAVLSYLNIQFTTAPPDKRETFFLASHGSGHHDFQHVSQRHWILHWLIVMNFSFDRYWRYTQVAEQDPCLSTVNIIIFSSFVDKFYINFIFKFSDEIRSLDLTVIVFHRVLFNSFLLLLISLK